MNEKQLNENLGISKSLNIHTASLDTFFFSPLEGLYFFYFILFLNFTDSFLIIHIFIASSLSRIFAYVYFLFAIQT